MTNDSDIAQWTELVDALAASYASRWYPKYEFDDFKQEGHLAVLKAYQNFDPEKSFTPTPSKSYIYRWIDMSMMSLIRSEWRVQKGLTGGYSEEMAIDEPVWDSVEAEIDLDRILTEIRPLTERDKKLLHMRYKKDMPLTAIADVEGVTFQAIDSRLRHLIASIQRELKGE